MSTPSIPDTNAQGVQTLAFKMQLKPGVVAEYKQRHDEIWPELSTALKEAGIADYWIFLDEATLSLFAVLKRQPGAAQAQAFAALDTLPVMRRWWDHMAPLMAVEPGNKPLQWPLPPLFHLP
ncbi:L-rhamnose mutarotase [Aquabacterium sp. OR-4]|uniref:L-rhamnose mutarotase n=1 Tax=Aquabacterium sp. OR-4 TaxID=2978127 RepID=UPI0028C5955C|nr:L-rhamnose mutarotase [Aquabacterium sp. OR-4]MDT7838892.1 L-rhamnose mutarotase [Aquabacterium sp. OR-4]